MTDNVEQQQLDTERFANSLMTEEGKAELIATGWSESSVLCLYQIIVEWKAWRMLNKYSGIADATLRLK